MSLSAMTNRAAAAGSAGEGRERVAPDFAKAIAAVAAYFPTETVGTYLAVLAIIQPQSTDARWAFYTLFLVFTGVVVLFYSWRAQQREPGQRLETRSLLWLLAFSGVSFTIWSATTPWTPFLAISGDAQKFAGAATIVLSPLLPMAAQVLRIAPPWR